MSDPNPNTSDLTITKITVPPFVLHGQPFNVTVSVISTQEDFDDGVAYRLFCFVCACQPDSSIKGLPQFFKGNLQEEVPGGWDTLTHDFTFTATAGTLFANSYTITAILLEGPKGVDPDSPPFSLSSSPILVV